MLKLNLADCLTTFEQGGYFDPNLSTQMQIGCMERLWRWLGSNLGICDSTTQKCEELCRQCFKKLNANWDNFDKNCEFFVSFKNHYDSPQVRLQLRKIFDSSPNSLEDICHKVNVVYEKADLKAARREVCNQKLMNVRILENDALTLKSNPRRPTESFVIPPEEKKACLEFYGENSVGALVVNHLDHITMDDLDSELKSCVYRLNQRLVEIGSPDYSVGVAQWKSSQWVTELALDHLLYLPSSGFSMNCGGTTTSSYGTRFADVKQLNEDVLVLMEDCSYSGNQIWQYVNDIYESRKKIERPLHIFVVVPFTSPSLENKLESFKKEAKVELITSTRRIKNILELEAFYKIEFETISATFPTFTARPNTPTLTSTDWRLPDTLSYLDGIGEEKNWDGNIIKDHLPTLRRIIRPYAIDAPPRLDPFEVLKSKNF